ncbi:hypothetical protein [Engelhardtia mirabilis]|uniref:Uncharacterized protein n=1 Tax=Engelhardtia mirabilis TaxID=2528011 RepID=A0A518BLH8_9BACT|nr:hypothetical protein Pla133_29180 [Planctomycetes bacterium Pla133]QDV02155.1 hypothetical protein Pla86_29170 [Planctomycetes bacterium Pla86]
MRASILIAALAGLLVAGIDFVLRAADLPDVAVRDRPPILVAGDLRGGTALVQTLPVNGQRLRRVEIAVRPGAPLGTELGTLYVEGTAGAPARARGRLVQGSYRGSAHLRFDFDSPQLDGSGSLRLGLSCPDEAALVPWLRARGVTGTRWDFGRKPLGPGELWRAVRPDLDRLSGFAIPMANLPADAGPVVLEVYAIPLEPEGRAWTRQPILSSLGLEGSDPGKHLRRVVLELPPPTIAGHLLLRFEPIELSRNHLFALRLSLPPGATTVGDVDGFGFVTLHGDPSELAGWSTTRGGRSLGPAELHTWVWTD